MYYKKIHLNTDCPKIAIMSTNISEKGVKEENEEKQSVMAYRLKCPTAANGGLSHYMFGESPADKALF